MINFNKIASRRNLLTNDDQWDQWLIGIYMKNAGHKYDKQTVQRKLAGTLMQRHSSWKHIPSLHFALCMLDNSHDLQYDDTDAIKRF